MRLLAVLLLAASLEAQDGTAMHDPFTASRVSINAQLTSMLTVSEPREPAAETNPAPSVSAQPVPSKLNPILSRLEHSLSVAGLPKEFVAVAFVESGGNPLALSPKNARGLWQLMPETARQYGLKVDAQRDERIEIERATLAAATYLQDLYARFHDWPLALAAYNAGPGRVQLALDRSHARTFDVLRATNSLPSETEAYVPAVLSAMSFFKNRSIPQPASSHWLYALTATAN